MMAIPRSLLIHDVILHHVSREDKWGNGALDSGIHVTRVRMEPSGKIARDKNNAEIQLAATMFYDCKNSVPRNQTFCVDDIMVFNGVRYKIQVVEPLYDGRKLHHYELGLIKSA